MDHYFVYLVNMGDYSPGAEIPSPACISSVSILCSCDLLLPELVSDLEGFLCVFELCFSVSGVAAPNSRAYV